MVIEIQPIKIKEDYVIILKCNIADKRTLKTWKISRTDELP